MFKRELEEYITLISQARAAVEIKGSFLTEGLIGDEDYEEGNACYIYEYTYNGYDNLALYSAKLKSLEIFLISVFKEKDSLIVNQLKPLKNYFILDKGKITHNRFIALTSVDGQITQNDVKEYISASNDSVQRLIGILDEEILAVFSGNINKKRETLDFINLAVKDLGIINEHGELPIGALGSKGTVWAFIDILSEYRMLVPIAEQKYIKAFWIFLNAEGKPPLKAHRKIASYIKAKKVISTYFSGNYNKINHNNS